MSSASKEACGCRPRRKRVEDVDDEGTPTARYFLTEDAYDVGGLGKYMSGGNFHKYMRGTVQGSWIFVKRIEEASDKVVVDDAWSSVTEESVPCVSSSFKKIPKKSCGESALNEKGKPQATFRWNDAWLFVVDLYKCQENDPLLYELIKSLCTPTAGYHCVSKQGGVEPGYVAYQFEKASHIMLMVSDCGQVNTPSSMSAFQSIKNALNTWIIPSNTCKFLVLGFAFLMTGVKMPKPDPMLLCNAMYYGLRDPGSRNVYVDIICSRFSAAQYMMRELLRNAKDNRIVEVLFGRKGGTFLCCLRAVPSVYTYYALLYGFTRTVDNRSVYPIFFVDADDIRANMDKLVADPPLRSDMSNDEIIQAIFGEAENKTDVVWKAPPGCSLYRIYRLEAPFRDFMKRNGMIEQPAKRVEFFPSVQVFHGDSGKNGYLFSKLVSK